LAKHIKQLSEDLLQIEEGSLYPALQRMLKQGWVRSKVGVSERNRPIRIYSLTNAGLKHLAKEVSSFERMFAGIRRVLAAVES
jgi:PadR family transcriptional regulator, regulatory protein PadR